MSDLDNWLVEGRLGIDSPAVAYYDDEEEEFYEDEEEDEYPDEDDPRFDPDDEDYEE